MSRRTVGHIALAVVAWILFGYYWWLVSRRRLNSDTITALSTLGVIVGSLCLATLLWIRHNLRVARRAGNRRMTRRPAPYEGETDSLGRPLKRVGSVPIQLAPYVELGIDPADEGKFYMAFDRLPGDLESS